MWHGVIDGSPADELLLGELRPLRSDDWLVGLPIALSQSRHEPSFPRVNPYIGLGQDLALSDHAMRHWTAIFRPFSWGFFLGDDVGVAWMWWSQVLGFALTWFLVFRRLVPDRGDLAAWGALFLLASPFLQLWAFLPGRFAAYAGLAVLGAEGVLSAVRPRGILAGAALLAWALGCLGLVLYPPYQVPLAQLAVLLFAGFVWQRRRAPGGRVGLRVACLAGAAAAATAVGLAFAADAAPSIERMLATAYPGQRLATGGDLPLWRLFAHDLLLAARVDDWSPLINIAEGASFWLFFPVAGALALRDAMRGRGDPISLLLLGYASLLALYAAVGIPEWLARLTGLSWSPPSRALVALGLADAALLIRQLSRPSAAGSATGFAAGTALAWMAFLAVLALPVHRTFPAVGTLWLAAALGANGLAAWAIAARWRPGVLLAGLTLVLAATTLGYNPLVRGGSTYLRENPLVQKITAIDRTAGGDTLWISYGPVYAGNLFRVIGVRALTGVHPLPELELWRQLDPEGHYESLYNRYAHVTARSSGAAGVRFRLAAPDSLEVIVEPNAPELRALGVTHALIVAPEAPRIEGATHVDSHAWNHLYRLGRGERGGLSPPGP
ncbi:MAG: hypothetical protein CL938_06680 [Deltaproteobacteria bacterium]|nr:hypothetical protein [Deltaproteobacteria bacterium]